jgi:hypothetical protein
MTEHKQVSLTLKSGRKIKVDVKLRNLIKALDEVGLTTIYSCQGDEKTSAYLALADTVNIQLDFSVLSTPPIPAAIIRWSRIKPIARLKRCLEDLQQEHPTVERVAHETTASTYLKYVFGKIPASKVYLDKRLPSGKRKRFYINKLIDQISEEARTSQTIHIQTNHNGFGDTPHLFVTGNEILCKYAKKLYEQLLPTAVPQFENGRLTYLGGFFKNGYVQLQAIGQWYLIKECVGKGVYRLSLRKLYPCEHSPSRMLCVDVIVGEMSWTNPN